MVVGRLSERTKEVLTAQFESIRFIQRTINDRMVQCAYRSTDSGPRFPNSTREFKLARVTFKGNGLAGMRCGIVVAGGKFKAMEFSKPPKLLTAEALDHMKVTVYEDKAWEVEVAPTEVRVGKILTEIQAQRTLTNLIPPATTSNIESFVQDSSTKFPRDLVELLSECDGFQCNGWMFNGTRSEQTPTSGDADIIRLVNSEQEPLFLCVKTDQSRAKMFLYQEEDEELTDYGPQFVPALLRVTKETDVDNSEEDPEGSWPPSPTRADD